VAGLGAPAAWLLHLGGWGKPSGVRPREQWSWKVKDPMTAHVDCLGCRMAGRRRKAGHGENVQALQPAVPARTP
jgi:hypothetical protein